MTNRLLYVVVLMSLLASGCAAGVVSGEFRKKAASQPPMRELFGDPDRFTDRHVIIGGVVATTTEAEDGVYIEVVERPLDYYEKPETASASRGMFVVHGVGKSSDQSYPPGTELTVAGTVKGGIERKLGDTLMVVPLIEAEELHPFKPKRGFGFRFGLGVFHSID